MEDNKKLKQLTIDTYNNSAKELAEYFRGIGSRTKDISLAIDLSKKERPDVLEVGCGDGRDAKEIVKKAGSYTGFDISSELISIARKYVPGANFIVADALEFDYGVERYDIIFAFASLLHLDIIEIEHVLNKIKNSLRPNGVVFISLKLAKKYDKRVKEDRFGTRVFYYYSPDDINKIVENDFIVKTQLDGFKTVGNTEWFETVLVKK